MEERINSGGVVEKKGDKPLCVEKSIFESKEKKKNCQKFTLRKQKKKGKKAESGSEGGSQRGKGQMRLGALGGTKKLS